MELSDGKKLILLMLAEVYRKLEINGEFDPEFIEPAILADQSWGIGWTHAGIPFADKKHPLLFLKSSISWICGAALKPQYRN